SAQMQFALPLDSAPSIETAAPTQQLALADWSLERWLAALAPPFERWHDRSGSAWPQARALRGGARLLELQSLCPFRSFAELRLSARALRSPIPGIDLQQTGRIVH